MRPLRPRNEQKKIAPLTQLTVKSTPFKQNSSKIDSMMPSRNEPLPAGAATWSGAFLQGKSPPTFASSTDAVAAEAAASPGVPLPVLKARPTAVLFAIGAGDSSHDDGEDTRPCARSERLPCVHTRRARGSGNISDGESRKTKPSSQRCATLSFLELLYQFKPRGRERPSSVTEHLNAKVCLGVRVHQPPLRGWTNRS